MTAEMKKTLTTQEVAERFDQLAQKELWFDIQDELFAEDVKSIEPEHSPYFKNTEGKGPVRKKGEDWVAKIQGVNQTHTTHPIVAGNHFAVGRNVDIMVEGLGNVKMNQIMLYEVKGGQIVMEKFVY